MKSLITGLSILAAANMAFAVTPTTTSSTTGAGETTAKVKEVKPAEKKWSVTLLQETYVMANQAHRQNFTGQVMADSYLGLGYKLNDFESVQVRQNFTMNQEDTTRDAEYKVSDTTLIYKNKEGFFVNETPFVNEFRLYLPGSEYATETGKIEGRYTAAFDQKLSSELTMTYSNNLRVYGYTKSSQGQRTVRNFTSGTATYKINDIVSPFVTLGYQVRWYRTGEGLTPLGFENKVVDPGDNYDKPYWVAGANIAAGPLGITIYAEQDHNLRKKGNDFKFANEDETFYSMVVSASM